MRFLKYIGWGLLGVLLVLAAWGFVEPRFYTVKEEAAVIPNLPEAWAGQRVAQISDFQIGIWLDNESTIRRVVEEIRERKPALVLLTGDFVYRPEKEAEKLSEIQQAVALVRPLTEAGLPTYAVLGNHDYGTANPQGRVDTVLAGQVRRALEGAGVTVLQNEAERLSAPYEADSERGGEALYLVGIGAVWPGQAHPQRALAGVPEAASRLVMMHNPEAFSRLPPRSAPLSVAGHTHGGQVRLPFSPEWSWLTLVKDDTVHADGWAAASYGAAGNRLYINRGLGMGVVPIRINCRPELTLFTLHPE